MGNKKKQKPPLPVLPEGVNVIDTHCHLDMLHSGTDLAETISRAASLGVSPIITIGIDLESSKKAVEIAALYDDVYATVGIHPHNVSTLEDSSYAELEQLCKNSKVVAYGEIGLDFVKKYAEPHEQLDHYGRQVRFAKKTGLPLVIHDREAHSEILGILKQEAPFPEAGIMHCFSGNWQLATKVLDLGFLISIPGVVTFKKADALQEVVRKAPLNRLVLETDAPFLAPDPYRGRPNIPEYLLYTAQKVADLRGVSLEEVARATSENARNLFHLKSR
jgi:TatD DNase family protein